MSYLVYIKQALANLFKPPVTSKYPLEPKRFCPGERGRVVNDISQCILCGMCERSCPAGAITVDRKTGTWKINPFSCIQCGACVEACPKKCLAMDPHYAAPALKKSEIILQTIQKEGKAEIHKEVAAIQTSAAALSMDDRSHIVNNVMKCIFCGMCERNCPAGAITVDRRSRTWRINLEACVNCGTCIDNCPRKCLSLGCYLGNRTEVTVHGKMPVRKVASKPVVKVEAKPVVAPVTSVDVPNTHIRNEIEKCLFCGKCEHTCPVQAISIDRKNRTWTIDREKCVTCGVCASDCPVHCLTLADTWEEGEKKEICTTYQGKVLTRRPQVRPAPPKAAEPPKPVEQPKPVAPAPIVPAAPAEDGPQSDNPWHVRNEIEKCLFCGKCEQTCPVDAISIDRKNRTWTIDRDKCVTCGACTEGCPKKCLTLAEEWVDGENRAIHLTLQGKVPQRPVRPATKDPAKVTVPAPAVAAAPVAEGPQSDNPWHVKNEIEKCLFCGKCEHTCPVDAISIDRKNRTWTIDRDKCVTCGACTEGCPKKCLTLAEEWENGENRAIHLTLQGKAPQRPARLAPKAAQKVEPAPEPPKVEEKPAEAANVPQSENSFHVKNNIDKCLFCGKCLHNCPAQAISIDRKNRTWTMDREKCMVCGVCAEGCPAKCLSMEEEWQEGENHALVLTLQGKPPVRRPRPAGNGSSHA